MIEIRIAICLIYVVVQSRVDLDEGRMRCQWNWVGKALD